MRNFNWLRFLISFLLFFVLSLGIDYLIYAKFNFLKSLILALCVSLTTTLLEKKKD